ncbi:TPA: hypothetical protein MW242_002616 [Acinetobacter baumannii]|nr:hypothetical protein [Acinetobacter baumannii]
MSDNLFTQYELRIGSYVTSKTWGGMHKVNAVSFKKNVLVVAVNGYDHMAKDGVFDELRSIPLTKSILEEFGFQSSKDCDTLYFLEVVDTRLGTSCKLTYDIGESRFQYLHELQDYIYGCTGVMIDTTNGV